MHHFIQSENGLISAIFRFITCNLFFFTNKKIQGISCPVHALHAFANDYCKSCVTVIF